MFACALLVLKIELVCVCMGAHLSRSAAYGMQQGSDQSSGSTSGKKHPCRPSRQVCFVCDTGTDTGTGTGTDTDTNLLSIVRGVALCISLRFMLCMRVWRCVVFSLYVYVSLCLYLNLRLYMRVC